MADMSSYRPARPPRKGQQPSNLAQLSTESMGVGAPTPAATEVVDRTPPKPRSSEPVPRSKEPLEMGDMKSILESSASEMEGVTILSPPSSTSLKIDVEEVPGHDEFQKRYTLGKLLGAGGFGEVRHAINKDTKKECAVKIMSVPSGEENAPAIHAIIKREVHLLQRMSHKSILKVQESYCLGPTYYLVTDFAQGGTLLDAVNADNGIYQEEEAVRVMWDICKAVEYLHKNSIVHKDIKLENILLKRKNRTSITIGDFGLAEELPPGIKSHESKSGSIPYLAPEVLACGDESEGGEPKTEGYDHRVDVWSLGVALYTLISGVMPFDDPDHDKLMEKVSKGDFTFPPLRFAMVSQHAKDLIRRMLTVDPDERITVQEIFDHPWMEKMKNEEEATRKWKEQWNLKEKPVAKPKSPRSSESTVFDMSQGSLRRNSYAGMQHPDPEEMAKAKAAFAEEDGEGEEEPRLPPRTT